MPSKSAEYTVQFAVVASLVDGEASADEIDILVDKVSELYKEDAEEIRAFAQSKIAEYTPLDFGNKPVRALKAAVEALHALDNIGDKNAFVIARAVVEKDGVSAKEDSFLARLAILA